MTSHLKHPWPRAARLECGLLAVTLCKARGELKL